MLVLPAALTRSQLGRVARCAAPALIAALLLAACGGGGNGASPTPTTTITKSDFVAQANAVCQVMNDKIKAMTVPKNDALKSAAYFDESAAVVQDTLDHLRALPVPAGDDTTVQSIYSKVDALLVDVAKFSAALRAGDKPAVDALAVTVKADQTAANEASNAYGLTVCGS